MYLVLGIFLIFFGLVMVFFPEFIYELQAPREFQREVFHIQLALAEELGLPVIVHDREGESVSIIIRSIGSH